jgi:23S rRNA pseudouridine2605 synthase
VKASPHSARASGRVTLVRALSKLGMASRTQAARLIANRKVHIDGRLATDPSRLVVPERIRIRIEGFARTRAPWILVALHKPRGVVTTRTDPEQRRTVYDCLSDLQTRVIAVGRLDAASSGLILMTSDTQLSHWLTDPSNAVLRRYLVTVRGRLEAVTARSLERGVVERGEILAARSVTVLKTSGKESHLIIELTEGKNREIRRMLAAVGHEVTRLKRIAFGAIELGDLQPGTWREISAAEAQASFPGAPVPSFRSS